MNLPSRTIILVALLCYGAFDVVSGRYLGARDRRIGSLSVHARKESCLPISPKANDNTTWPAYAASQRGVPSFLDSIKNNRIVPSRGNTKNWLEGFWDVFSFEGTSIKLPQPPDCQNLESQTCLPPDVALCDQLAPVYWTLNTIANFHGHMHIINAAFKDAVFNDSFHIQALSNDFPIQTGAPVVDFLGLLNNVAASMGVIGGVLGLGGEAVAFSGGMVGVFGGILGQVASNLEKDPEDPSSVGPALMNRMGSIFSSVTNSTARFLEAVFVDGDLTDFPGITLPGTTDYQWSISALFDNGNFFYGTEYTVVSAADATTKISGRLLQLLTGVALTEANWYVLRNSYTVDQCPTDQTGRLIGGTCFTLERPGLGGKLGGADRRGEYSLQMDVETLDKVFARNVMLEDLYLSSNDCQKKTKAYNVQGTMSISSFQSSNIEPCFYNLPVLTVTTDDLDEFPYRASPCSVLFANRTATKGKSEPVAGVTYLPSNLQQIFSESGFCSIDKFKGEPGTD